MKNVSRKQHNRMFSNKQLFFSLEYIQTFHH